MVTMSRKFSVLQSAKSVSNVLMSDTYNYGRRLKTLAGLTPYEFICKRWTIEPEKFMLNPIHQMPGLNS
jgi:hypothetical protein